MKLTRATSYALIAMLELAQRSPTEPVPCHQLAANANLPARFLLQILRDLVTHDVLRSTRGAVGGYSLARPANQTSLLDVIEAVEGPFEDVFSLWEGWQADGQHQLQASLRLAIATMRRQLANVKLSQLFKSPARSRQSSVS